MNNCSNLLPINPTYDEACHIIDDSPEEFWFPVLINIQNKHQLPKGQWQRINEGGNVLFKLLDNTGENNLIIKLVPPNWKEQGTAEVEATRLLKGKLSLPIPEVITSGVLNSWQYVVMTLLSGISLADVWNELPEDNKRSIVSEIGSFMRELHQLPIDNNSSLCINWQEYQQTLLEDCVSRHTRKKVPESLVKQIPQALERATDYFDDDEIFFIHMDLHPWNLMVDKTSGQYKISGVLDFGDAVIGRSRLLELNTPLLFLCQGNAALVKILFDSYQLIENKNPEQLRTNLMAVALLRPACDFNFVLQQVPQTGARDNWGQIAKQLFPV